MTTKRREPVGEAGGESDAGGTPRKKHPALKTVVLATAAGAAVAGGVVVLGRIAVQQARARPDPGRVEPLEDRPGESRRVRSFDGTELAVNVVGPQRVAKRAPVLVFIHGLSLNLTCWYYQWRELSKRYRCVLYDQRGHGESAPAAGGDYSLQALGEDLKAVLDDVVPQGPVVLIGHSMGGMAIIAFAEANPEEFGGRVKAVVLSNTTASDLVRSMAAGLGTRLSALVSAGTARLTAAPERAWKIRSRAFAGKGDAAYLVARATNFGPKAPPSMVEHVIKQAAMVPVEVWTDLLKSLIEMDLGHAIEHVRVPALVIGSDVDRITPSASGLAITRKLPQGRMVLFKAAGHCVMLERHEQWNELVEDFVRESVPTPQRTRARTKSSPEPDAGPSEERTPA